MEEEQLTKKEKRALAKEEKRKEVVQEEQSSKFKKLFVWLVILGVISWFGYKTYRYFTSPIPEAAVTPIEITQSDWVRGDQEAKVVLLEYGDFQCPACATYAPIVKKLLDDTPQGLKVVYREFPLVQIHQNSMASAKAAEAAGKQGKYWEMHEALYEKQSDWADLGDPKDKFLEYAKSFGLDEQQFLIDYDSQDVSDKITADLTSGNVLKINSTPTFFLNGKIIQPRSYEQFKSLVDTEIRGYEIQ